jgi:hypothetical protein
MPQDNQEKLLKPDQLDIIGYENNSPVKEKDDAKAKIEIETLFGDHERGEGIKKQIHKLIIVLLIVCFITAVILLVIRACILVIPENWNWLSEKQIMTLDSLAKYAVSSAVGALVTKYLNRSMDK